MWSLYCLPGEGIMSTADELIVAKPLSAIWRFQFLRFLLERVQCITKVNIWNIHNNVQKGYGGARIVDCLRLSEGQLHIEQIPTYLVCKPDMLGALGNSFHLFRIIVSIFEEEYQSVDWFT